MKTEGFKKKSGGPEWEANGGAKQGFRAHVFKELGQAEEWEKYFEGGKEHACRIISQCCPGVWPTDCKISFFILECSNMLSSMLLMDHNVPLISWEWQQAGCTL